MSTSLYVQTNFALKFAKCFSISAYFIVFGTKKL
jgi:hypothetical protein